MLTANKMFQNNALMMIPVRTVRIMGRWSPTKPAACPPGAGPYHQLTAASNPPLPGTFRLYTMYAAPVDEHRVGKFTKAHLFTGIKLNNDYTLCVNVYRFILYYYLIADARERVGQL